MDSFPSASNTRHAMQLTYGAITTRLVRYRFLVIAVAPLVLFSLVGALVCLSWVPLTGLVLLFPLCGLFFCGDILVINRWQQKILAMWAEERLKLFVFAETITKTPGPPPPLLKELVGSLPDRHPGGGQLPPLTRQAVARTLQTLNWYQFDKTAAVMLAYTTGGAGLAAASLWGSWFPLLGLLAIPLVPILSKLLSLLRFRSWRRYILRMEAQGLEGEGFLQAAGQLHWGPLPDKLREGLFPSLQNAGRALPSLGTPDACGNVAK